MSNFRSKSVKNRIPYTIEGVPAPDSGARILSVREAAAMMVNAPCGLEKAMAAIERINNLEGQPRLIQKIMHEDVAKNVGAVRLNAYHIQKQNEKRGK